MAVDRDVSRELYFECDGCGELLSTGTEEFPEALTELTANSWVSRKARGEQGWRHYCPSCRDAHPKAVSLREADDLLKS